MPGRDGRKRWGIRNPLKAKLSRGQAVWGTFVFEFASPSVPRILKEAGWDYILIDTEHASFGIDTVSTLLHVSSTIDLPALVRVPETQRSLLSRPLDAGASGLMIPRVESRTQAEAIVRYTKFPPAGDRGVVLGTAQNAYRPVDGRRFLRQANAELLLIMQIETLAGLEHMDQILSVPGLDVALIGPYDLSTSMGIPGDMNHPRMRHAIEAFLKSCRRHRVVPGNFVTTVEDGRAWLRRGMRFLIYSVDFLLVMERSQQVLSQLRPKRRTDDRRPR
ncbi:MAG TPA: aldolase/citrate lyase family protein [Candidatus Methylomirabilis sp.]|nr:aldolase/citrate lyase family protein [Candidatus Methylomirabilis sp.]